MAIENKEKVEEELEDVYERYDQLKKTKE